MGAQRTYELADFPYFFGDGVDLMYAGKEAIGGDVLSQAGLLQRAFDAAGKKLVPRKANSVAADCPCSSVSSTVPSTLQDDLATRQISITLAATDAATATVASDVPGRRHAHSNPGRDFYAGRDLHRGHRHVDSASARRDAHQGAGLRRGPRQVPDRERDAAEPGQSERPPGDDRSGRDPKRAWPRRWPCCPRGDLSQCLASSSAALCPAMPTFAVVPTDVYVPQPQSDIPVTTTSDYIQPVEPPATFEPPSPAGTRAP